MKNIDQTLPCFSSAYGRNRVKANQFPISVLYADTYALTHVHTHPSSRKCRVTQIGARTQHHQGTKPPTTTTTTAIRQHKKYFVFRDHISLITKHAAHTQHASNISHIFSARILPQPTTAATHSSRPDHYESVVVFDQHRSPQRSFSSTSVYQKCIARANTILINFLCHPCPMLRPTFHAHLLL